MEGLEAWDTAMRCTGQARVAPSGRVVGLDLGVALHLGRAIGYGETALAELLPSIEAGMVAGVAKLIEQGADHGNE